MKFKEKFILFVLVVSLFVIAYFLILPSTRVIHLTPIEANDSDGNPSSDIIQRIVAENDFEDVILKVKPFGYVTVKEWNDRTTEISNVKKTIVNVQWKTDVNRGAGNIYIGYSTDEGNSFTEIGPYNESGNVQNTAIELSKPFTYDLKKVQVRWRGEDLDYRLAAKGYVKFEMDIYV